MENRAETIQELKQLIEHSKRLKQEIEKSIAEISKIIESAQVLMDRNIRELRKTPRAGQKDKSS